MEANVLGNDFDPESDTQEVNVSIITQPMHGTVDMNTDGSFTYIPNEDYIGPDSFVYEVCDNGNPQACDMATVYITISGVLANCNIVFPGQEDSEYDGFGFSPNGDGENDLFSIPGLIETPNFTMEVFDRWGNSVYQYDNNGSLNPDWWNGESSGNMTLSKGQLVPAGTYFYLIQYNDGNKSPDKGWVYVNY